MREVTYQNRLIKKLETLFPGATVLKNNPQHIQGIPDLTVLWLKNWAALEVKKCEDEPYRPNQKYWIEYLGNHSFSACIYPENEEEVLDALQHAFRSS
jgi:hypothetical protein